MVRAQRFASLSILLAAFAGTVFAQADLAVLVGNISDQKGALVPQASVTATNVATGVASSVKSNLEGFYRLPNLRFGVYRVEVTRSGFTGHARQLANQDRPTPQI